MANQIRQQTSGRTIGLRGIVGVAVGTVAMSAALVAGGLGWQRASAPRADQRASIHTVASFADASVSPAEFDYLRVLSDEQVQRYIAARPARFQAHRFTRGAVLIDELNYLRVLNDEQVRRYVAARQSTPSQ